MAALLKDIHRLRERRFHAGDFAACDILADLQTAINRAGLTNRQRQALYWVYERDLTQKDAGEAMGIAQKNVSEMIERATESIADIYAQWDYEDITVNYDTSLEEESLDEIR